MKVPPLKMPPMSMKKPSFQGMSFRGIKPTNRSSRESWNSSSVQCGTENNQSRQDQRLYTPDIQSTELSRAVECDFADGYRIPTEKAESEANSVYSMENENTPNPFDESVMQFDEPDLEVTVF